MSSPNVLEDATDIIERFWDLYVIWCSNHGVEPKLDGFMPWYEERYI